MFKNFAREKCSFKERKQILRYLINQCAIDLKHGQLLFVFYYYIILFIYFAANWKNELQEFIDGSNLPEYYGGTCRDPDGNPKCLSKVRQSNINNSRTASRL